MGDLSKNFNRSEFACHCGCGFDTPCLESVDALEKLRKLINKPINVTSGCRCPVHNSNVGSSEYSQHPRGRAADIWVKGMSPKELAKYAEQIPEFKEGGIGIYDNFVHVDTRVKHSYWSKPARW